MRPCIARYAGVQVGNAVRYATALSCIIAFAACGIEAPRSSARVDPRAQVRATVEAYLLALRDGDGARACRLISPRALASDGYRSPRQCSVDHSHARPLGRFHVLAIRLPSPDRAIVIIDDQRHSDSGNDSLELSRVGERWLLESD